MAFENTRAGIDEYVKQKTWYWYLPVGLLGVYAFFAILRLRFDEPMPLILLIPQSFDFVLHEMAHIVTAFLPPILSAAAGSMSEILLGAALIYAAFKTHNYMTSMVGCLWFMLACHSAGAYMADARAQQMDLVSLGGALSGEAAVHDWNFVFGRLHLLNLDTVIGGAVFGVGIVVGLFGTCFAGWLMYRMAMSSR